MRLSLLCVLLLGVCCDVSGFLIRNKLLGKCLQVQDEFSRGGRVSLAECDPSSSLQGWRWLPDLRALSSQLTGECVTAPGEQFEGVGMQPCIATADSEEAGAQAWSCSKRGLLTLLGRGLHLSASQESTLVFLSKEHKQGSKWRTLENQTLCSENNHQPPRDQLHHHLEKSLQSSDVLETHSHAGPPPVDAHVAAEGTDADLITDRPPWSLGTKSTADPTMVFFSMDYGMSWKITMLVLSSLALVLGTVILIVNVYSNRRKKVVCVLKSYSPNQQSSVPSSPVPNERARLTENAMRPPVSTPSTHRGEILIEWKDGTVTPLYEA